MYRHKTGFTGFFYVYHVLFDHVSFNLTSEHIVFFKIEIIYNKYIIYVPTTLKYFWCFLSFKSKTKLRLNFKGKNTKYSILIKIT